MNLQRVQRILINERNFRLLMDATQYEYILFVDHMAPGDYFKIHSLAGTYHMLWMGEKTQWLVRADDITAATKTQHLDTHRHRDVVVDAKDH